MDRKSLAQEAMAQPKSFGSKVEIVQGSRNIDQQVALIFWVFMKQGHEVRVLCLQSDSKDLQVPTSVSIPSMLESLYEAFKSRLLS